MADRDQPAEAVHSGLYHFLLVRADRIRSYAHSKIPSRLAAVISPDDIFQEVCVNAFRSYADFRWDQPDSLDRWLTTLTENELIDAIRTADGRRKGGQHYRVEGCEVLSDSMASFLDLLISPDRTPSRDASGLEAVSAVQAALETLPQEQRQVITLYHLEGHTLDAVAESMALSMNQVKHLLALGRLGLRRRLGAAGNYFTDVITAEQPLPSRRI